MTERLGKETVKDFDHCALSLSPALDPVVTPEGVLAAPRAHPALPAPPEEGDRAADQGVRHRPPKTSKAELEAGGEARAEAIERLRRRSR